MGNAFSGQITFLSKQAQASELRIRQFKPFALILHALLAALKQSSDKILKFIQLIPAHITVGIILKIVHGMNYIRTIILVNYFFDFFVMSSTAHGTMAKGWRLEAGG